MDPMGTTIHSIVSQISARYFGHWITMGVLGFYLEIQVVTISTPMGPVQSSTPVTPVGTLNQDQLSVLTVQTTIYMGVGRMNSRFTRSLPRAMSRRIIFPTTAISI